MTNPCIDCGDEHVYEVNADLSQEGVQREGNRVIIPRRYTANDITVQALNNVDLSLEATDREDVVALGWDPVACKVVPLKQPCPVVIDWDSTEIESPAELPDFADNCSECNEDTGRHQMVSYRDVGAESECLTHVCINGELYCLGATALPQNTEFVCYDVSGWNFPVSYGGGQGQWDVFGNNEVDEVCADGSTTIVPVDLEFACWGDPGYYTSPANNAAFGDWNDLPWATETISPPDEIRATSSSHGCARPAFRWDPNIPVGSTGDIAFTFELTEVSGQTSFAAYDIISGQNLEIVGQPAQPSGPIQPVENTPFGEIYKTTNAPLGFYTITFRLAPGMQAENVRFLLWNMGGTGGDAEAIRRPTTTVNVPAETCCLDWNDSAEIAAWMVSKRPGVVVSVAGDCICLEVGIGVGSNYGTLGHCDTADNVTPTVSTDPTCI